MENRERPYIGVTASFFENEKNPPLSQQTVGRDYIRSVLQAGGIPIMIPAMQDETQIEAYAQMVDGLLLPGEKMYAQSVMDRSRMKNWEKPARCVTARNLRWCAE